MFLPPYGKFFDPIELVFSEVKRIYDQEISQADSFCESVFAHFPTTFNLLAQGRAAN